jgi:hypothetical protein
MIVDYKTPIGLCDHDFNHQLAMYSQGMGDDAIYGGACTYKLPPDYAALEARAMAWYADRWSREIERMFHEPFVKDDGNIPVEAIDSVSQSAKSEALNTTSGITIARMGTGR